MSCLPFPWYRYKENGQEVTLVSGAHPYRILRNNTTEVVVVDDDDDIDDE